MANTFKNYLQRVSSSNTTILTVAASTQTTVIGMSIANLTTAPISCNVFVTSSATDYYMVKDDTIAVGGDLIPIGGDQKLVLEATDIIKVSSTAACDVILSALEIT